jgi:hypothetical protein
MTDPLAPGASAFARLAVVGVALALLWLAVAWAML